MKTMLKSNEILQCEENTRNIDNGTIDTVINEIDEDYGKGKLFTKGHI